MYYANLILGRLKIPHFSKNARTAILQIDIDNIIKHFIK